MAANGSIVKCLVEKGAGVDDKDEFGVSNKTACNNEDLNQVLLLYWLVVTVLSLFINKLLIAYRLLALWN